MSRPSSGAIKNAKSVKLHYFNGRGRAEKIRLAFAASGLSYKDESIDFKDWPAFKPKTPHGSMPVLDVDGKLLGQSNAIFRFVAVEGGLTGTDSVDDAVLDGVVDATSDVEGAAFALLFAKDQALEDAKKKLFEKVLPGFLTSMESFLKSTGSGWFSKKGLTWADIAVFCVLDGVQDFTGQSEFYSSYPLVKKLMKDVAESKGIKEYLAKRSADGLTK